MITMADDQGGTLDVKLLELLCFTHYKNKVTRTLKMENHGAAKSIGKGCRPIRSKRNNQIARQAPAWAAGTLCRSSRAAANVYFLFFISFRSDVWTFAPPDRWLEQGSDVGIFTASKRKVLRYLGFLSEEGLV